MNITSSAQLPDGRHVHNPPSLHRVNRRQADSLSAGPAPVAVCRPYPLTKTSNTVGQLQAALPAQFDLVNDLVVNIRGGCFIPFFLTEAPPATIAVTVHSRAAEVPVTIYTGIRSVNVG